MAKRKYAEPNNALFTTDHYRMLTTERRNLNEMIATLEKAEHCGVDCAMYRQMRNDIDRQLEQIQIHFMTPPPA